MLFLSAPSSCAHNPTHIPMLPFQSRRSESATQRPMRRDARTSIMIKHVFALLTLSILASPASSEVDLKLLISSQVIPVERLYPHYVPVSPCPCDVSAKCDVYCCCDGDCVDDTYHDNLTCLGGHPGGQRGRGLFPTRNCSVLEMSFPWTLVGDHHVVTCLADENTPYLGKFYTEDGTKGDVLDTAVRYDVRVNLARRAAAHRVTYGDEKVEIERARGEARYKQGAGVATVYNRNRALFGRLSLPANALNGACLPAPIRYLLPFESTCSRDFDTEACDSAKGSFLDPASYAADAPPFVPISVGAEETAPVVTKYFSSKEYKYKYVSIHGRHQLYSESKVDGADKIVDGVNEAAMSEFKFNGRHFSHTLTELDAKTLDARYDGGRELCVNVALDVEYRVFWRGVSIVRIEKDVLVGDIALTSDAGIPKRALTQHFLVTFHHEPAKKPVRVEHTSGNPGYDVGKPVIVGDFSYETGFVKKSSGLLTWHPAATSLCRDATVVPVAFSCDVSTACSIQLSADNFTNCEALVTAVSIIQDALVSASVVAKGGNPKATNAKDFLQVIHYDPTEVQHNYNLNSTAHAIANATYFTVVSAANATLPPPGVVNFSLPVDSCLVPSRLSVQITFSRAAPANVSARSNATPIFRVNGVRVTREYERWTWQCRKNSGTAVAACKDVVNYDLSHTVAFEEIPLVWHHQNTSRSVSLNSSSLSFSSKTFT
jgi:hypothetical protein